MLRFFKQEEWNGMEYKYYNPLFIHLCTSTYLSELWVLQRRVESTHGRNEHHGAVDHSFFEGFCYEFSRAMLGS